MNQLVDELGSIGLIVPDALVDKANEALTRAGVVHSQLGNDDDIDARVDVVPASLAKGLEFDHVVLVEPADIAASETDTAHRPAPGLRLPDPRRHLAGRRPREATSDPLGEHVTEVRPPDQATWLRERWLRRFVDLGGIGEVVLAAYGEDSRIYHDVRHLYDVVTVVDLLGGESLDPDAVELAAWFHDVVYDVRRTDNEASSADQAARLLAPHLEPERVDEVVRLVLLTRDHQVTARDANGAVLCDADLAVLARSPERYDEYAARVRLEYAHVDDDAFRAGRAEVLRSLLALPSLFATAYGRQHWESPARANLHRELAPLP